MQNTDKAAVFGTDAVKTTEKTKSAKCDNLSQSAYPDGMIAGEKKIIDALVRDALAAGCTISVGHPLEGWDVKLSRDYAEITANIAVADETLLRIRQGEKHAAFFFVHGNEPYEVLNDHTDNAFAHALWAGAEKVRSKIEGQMCGVTA